MTLPGQGKGAPTAGISARGSGVLWTLSVGQGRCSVPDYAGNKSSKGHLLANLQEGQVAASSQEWFPTHRWSVKTLWPIVRQVIVAVVARLIITLIVWIWNHILP